MYNQYMYGQYMYSQYMYSQYMYNQYMYGQYMYSQYMYSQYMYSQYMYSLYMYSQYMYSQYMMVRYALRSKTCTCMSLVFLICRRDETMNFVRILRGKSFSRRGYLQFTVSHFRRSAPTVHAHRLGYYTSFMKQQFVTTNRYMVLQETERKKKLTDY